MKRFIAGFLLLALLLSAQTALAVNQKRNYTFDLNVNGQHEVRVQKGDVITVVFTLQRTDSTSAYTMYAMQNEIRYDDEFVRIIEDGSIVSADVRTKDVPLIDGSREFYMNYVSFADGVQWKANQLVGTFQMEILADTGISKLTNENYKVSIRDGSDAYQATANDLTLIVSDECVVSFETNGGTPIEDITVLYGEKLARPEEPVKSGWHVAGWYRDIDLTQEWNFDEDTVDSNMTLYAKWAEGDPQRNIFANAWNWIRNLFAGLGDCLSAWWPWWLLLPGALLLLLILLLLFRRGCRVIFETNGGAPIDAVRVKKNDTLDNLPVPVRGYSTFSGWYKDQALTDPWYAGVDKVKKRKTILYAKWQ